MGLVLTLAKTYLRAWLVDGVPSSGINPPSKTDGLAAFQQIDSQFATLALFSAIGVFEDTLAHLNANLTPAANTGALVYNDATVANNGVYVKVGGTGTGSWSATGIGVALGGAPWASSSWTQVSGLAIAIQNVSLAAFEAVNLAISGNPDTALNAVWTTGGQVIQGQALSTAIKTALGYSDAQMTTLFAAAQAAAATM